MNLRRRIISLERTAILQTPDVPELLGLPLEQRQLLQGKERARAMETALFECRGTPAHCWELSDEQIAIAVQIRLDEMYPAHPSPFDVPISDHARAELERTIREQM